MPLFHIVVLAVVQGITEFLPISSSGHLIIGWKVLEVTTGVAPPSASDQLAMDVAVHFGTLGAVMVYLWREVWQILVGLALALRWRRSPGLSMFGLLVMATVPIVVAGYLIKRYAGDSLRNVEIIAWASIGFGILLYVVDRLCLTVKRMEHMDVPGALVVGLAQVLALIPGTSRSGITMTAARMLGYERPDAARFSMLLAIPVILAATALSSYEVYQAGNLRLGLDAAIGAAIAFAVALVAILAMMSWLRRASFTPFVIYRVLLGLVLLAWVYGFFARYLPAPAL